MSSQARVTRRELLKTTALCVGAAATGPLWSGSSAAAAASLAGQQVNVLHQAGGFWDPWRAQMPNFEKKTGIKVSVESAPEAALLPKVRVTLGAKSDAYDVIFWRGNLMPELISAGSAEPLDSYIAKSKAEDREFTYEDLIPANQEAFAFEGKQWGIAQRGGGFILFYLKDAFAQAGLTKPPVGADQLEEYAKKLTTPTRSGFLVRGQREGAANTSCWILIWKMQNPKWYDNIRGNWFNEKWEPQLATKEAIAATDWWARVLRAYGPKGVSGYTYAECLAEFQQGTAALWIDDPIFYANVEDPKASKVAGRIGYSTWGPLGEHSNLIAPWGLIMTAYSKKKEAAWEFIKWATSRQTQLDMVRDGFSLPTRRSAFESNDMKKRFSAEFLQALSDAGTMGDPAYAPVIPQQAEIRDALAIALSKVLSNQVSAADGMREANDKAREIMKRDGYIK